MLIIPQWQVSSLRSSSLKDRYVIFYSMLHVLVCTKQIFMYFFLEKKRKYLALVPYTSLG
jgi:short subunit fatty acids transporter